MGIDSENGETGTPGPTGAPAGGASREASGPHGVERRRHLRVQDAVGLHFKRLTDMPAAGEPAAPAPQRPTRVRRANKYDIDGYGETRRHYPAIAAYIDELEERIRQLLLDGDPVPSAPTHKVSLSIGGMAFADARLLEIDELIGLTLTLFPSGRRVGCDAQVVSANDAPEIGQGDLPTYRIAFLRMSDADRDALAAHVKALSSVRPRDG